MTLTGRLSTTFCAVDGRPSAHVQTSSPLELRGPFPGGVPRYFLRNVTAGMLDGDECEIAIRVNAGTLVAVAPSSAAKVFISRGRGSVLSTTIEVESGALLDYDAGLTIPHAGAVARQDTSIILHEGARIAYADAFAFGRIASGERFAFERFESSLRITTPSGLLLHSRRSLITPGEQREFLAAAVGNAGVLGSLLLLGAGDRPPIPEVKDAYAGISTMPHGIGWQVKVLAARPEQSDRVLCHAREAWLASDASIPG